MMHIFMTHLIAFVMGMALVGGAWLWNKYKAQARAAVATAEAEIKKLP